MLPFWTECLCFFSLFIFPYFFPLDFISSGLHAHAVCVHTHPRPRARSLCTSPTPLFPAFSLSGLWKMLQPGLTIMRFKWAIWPRNHCRLPRPNFSFFFLHRVLFVSFYSLFSSFRAVVNIFSVKLPPRPIVPCMRALGERNRPVCQILNYNCGGEGGSKRSSQGNASRNEFKPISDTLAHLY